MQRDDSTLGEPGQPGQPGIGTQGGAGGEGGRGGTGREPIHKWRWRFLTAWIILFTIVVCWAIRANRERVNDIQQARLYSCITGYSGTESIFRDVFLPPDPDTWTQQEKQLARRFHKKVEKRQAQCPKQTKVGGNETR